jgi:hypothetical protein
MLLKRRQHSSIRVLWSDPDVDVRQRRNSHSLSNHLCAHLELSVLLQVFLAAHLNDRSFVAHPRAHHLSNRDWCVVVHHDWDSARVHVQRLLLLSRVL